MTTEVKQFTKKDFTPDGMVKWCAGCGDFSILAQTQKVLAEIGRPPEDFAFISGIGCSSRFPYYVNTYGYHTIHGRALSIATGAKVHNPDLSVWVAMGDGDGLSIGGNHFLHTVRRNVDIVCILMDNQIYGLTKGQFSPTSLRGQQTKTSPFGTTESPMDPIAAALGVEGTFVARSTDRNPKHLQEMLRRAYAHKGFSLVHVLQNCHIFNDKCFDDYVGKENGDNRILLEHGKPMIFGNDNDKAIVIDGFDPKVVNVADVDASEIAVHDEFTEGVGNANFVNSMAKDGNGFPMPLGVIREIKTPAFDEANAQLNASVIAKQGKGDLQTLLNAGDTWTV